MDVDLDIEVCTWKRSKEKYDRVGTFLSNLTAPSSQEKGGSG